MNIMVVTQVCGSARRDYLYMNNGTPFRVLDLVPFLFSAYVSSNDED